MCKLDVSLTNARRVYGTSKKYTTNGALAGKLKGWMVIRSWAERTAGVPGRVQSREEVQRKTDSVPV